jgi:hypothetical protein
MKAVSARKKSPEYQAWKAMKERCHSPGHKNFAHYSGRGIVVCERWKNSFDLFLEDLGHMPAPRLTIERINNDGNYEPGNCRWATRKEQAQNTSRNIYFQYQGKKICLSELARTDRCCVRVGTLRKRLIAGWTLHRAMTTPSREAASIVPRMLTFRDETLSLKEWALRMGLLPRSVHNRIARGWSVELALTTPSDRTNRLETLSRAA